MPFTWLRSPRSATAALRGAPTTTARSQRAWRTSRHSGRSSDASATRSTGECSPTPDRLLQQSKKAREGNWGTTLYPAWPAHTPKRRLSGAATPGPGQTLDRSAQPRTSATHHAEQRQREEPLDNKEASICA